MHLEIVLFSGAVVKNQQKSFSLGEILLVSLLIKHLEVEQLDGGQALPSQQTPAAPIPCLQGVSAKSQGSEEHTLMTK